MVELKTFTKTSDEKKAQKHRVRKLDRKFELGNL